APAAAAPDPPFECPWAGRRVATRGISGGDRPAIAGPARGPDRRDRPRARATRGARPVRRGLGRAFRSRSVGARRLGREKGVSPGRPATGPPVLVRNGPAR